MRPYDETINMVSLYDYSEYDERRCHADGVHGYRRDYIRIPDTEFWRIEYWATRGCCPVCGAIAENCDCTDNYELVSTDELVKVIDEFNERLVDYYGENTYWINMW